MKPDIIEKIQNDFSRDDAGIAIELLTASGETGRVARCIVVAADGNLQSLRDQIDVASRDYRDAIIAGEYSGVARDLTSSFLIDAPDKFWISYVASALYTRGFVLKSIEARPATIGPFVSTSDRGEGVATFAGEMGQLRISKQNGKWTLDGDPNELKLYGLNRAIGDEREFADEVSCYVLAKQKPRPAAKRVHPAES